MKPVVSILIVNYKTPQLVIDCIKSIEENIVTVPYEIIVVDNDSTQKTISPIRQCYPHITLIANPENSGFGVGNNIASQYAKGEYLFLTNSDTILQEDTITPLLLFLQTNKKAAMVGPCILLPDGTKQPKICGNKPTLRRLLNDALLLSEIFPRSNFFQGLHCYNIAEEVREVGWISGVCMLIRKQAYRKIEGFDPSFFMYCEDIDLCLRITKESGPVYHMNSFDIIHLHGASSKNNDKKIKNSLLQQENFLRILQKTMSSQKVSLARRIIMLGLFNRIIIAYILKFTGQKRATFLFDSCRARLAVLWSAQL